MKQRALGLWIVLLLVGALAMPFIVPAPLAAESPNTGAAAIVAPMVQDGAALLEDRCTKCHNLQRVQAAQKTAEQWKTTVERMVSKGAKLSAEEQKVLIDYLAATYKPAGAAEPAEKPSVYKVGFISHLTGDAAVYGQSLKMGTELAVDMINAAGGINGVPVEVIYEDDRLSAADAQTAFLKLVETDKVPVILGSASSTISLSLCPKAQEKKVVQVSQVSTAPALKDCGPYFFSVMASDTAQGPEWVKVAEYLGVKEAAVMYINNDYGIGVKDTFVQAFEAAGGKLLIVQPFELGGKDFRTEILKVKGTNPPVVFIVDHVAEASIVFKQAAELGLKTQWVTDVSIVSPEVPQLAGKEAVEGIMGLRAGSSQTPEYQAFREAFLKKFEKEPTIWADFAYDAMMLVAKAIEKGGYTADGIQKALFEVAETYVGPSGAKKFDEYGISQGSYEWVVVKDGEWVLYEKTPTATETPEAVQSE